jgi:Tfp pilus assembly protein PilP
VARRDPFDPLLNKPSQGGGTENLPPGKAGLVVGTLRIDGIVGGAHGMIAIVSNPQQRVYFLREGDKLYDGSVQHITIEAVSFQEFGKDAFGKPLERQVTKRLYPSPGEQQ